MTRATFIPLLASGNSPNLDAGVVREEYCADLTLVYSLGPPFGRRVVTHADMEQMELTPRTLRRSAFEQLEMLARDRAQFHGQPPSLMLSFDGLESSLLLATEFWSRLQGALPGDLVVGVPARDVVIVTGSQLPQGLEKVRRAVDRVYFAGDENLLTRSLLVRRGGTWEPFDRPARHGTRRGAHPHTADGPPRQYQEHQSWPGERVPVAAASMPAESPLDRPTPTGRPGPSPVPLAPAAAANMPRPSATSLPPPPVPAPPPVTGPRPGPMTPSGLPTRGTPPMSRPGPMMPTSPPIGAVRPMSGTAPMAGAAPMGGAVPPIGGAVPRPGAMPPRRGAGPSGPRSGGVAPGGPTPGAYAVRVPDPARLAERARPAVPDAAQYSSVPYSAVPQSAVPYSAMPYSAIPSSVIPSSVIPSSAIPSSAVPNSAVPYSAMPSSAGRSSAPVSPGYPQPAFSRGARSRQAKPAYRDDPYPTSGGSRSGYMPVSPAPYPASAPPSGYMPVSPAPYPASAPPSAPRVSPPPYGARPAYSGPSYEPNPPYQGASRDYERASPGYPSWSEASANDTFSGLFARGDAPGRPGFDGRSGPRARFTR